MLRNLAWVYPDHDRNGQEHDTGIESVQERLVRDDVPIVALHVLRHADNGSNKDKNADGVEAGEMFFPWKRC